MAQIEFDESSLIEAEKLAEILSELSEEDKRIVFYTINCMLMLHKVHKENENLSGKQQGKPKEKTI